MSAPPCTTTISGWSPNARCCSADATTTRRRSTSCAPSLAADAGLRRLTDDAERAAAELAVLHAQVAEMIATRLQLEGRIEQQVATLGAERQRADDRGRAGRARRDRYAADLVQSEQALARHAATVAELRADSTPCSPRSAGGSPSRSAMSAVAFPAVEPSIARLRVRGGGSLFMEELLSLVADAVRRAGGDCWPERRWLADVRRRDPSGVAVSCPTSRRARSRGRWRSARPDHRVRGRAPGQATFETSAAVMARLGGAVQIGADSR